MTMTESSLMNQMNLELALKEIDDMLSYVRRSDGAVTASRVVDNLLDIRNLLVPVLQASAN